MLNTNRQDKIIKSVVATNVTILLTDDGHFIYGYDPDPADMREVWITQSWIISQYCQYNIDTINSKQEKRQTADGVTIHISRLKQISLDIYDTRDEVLSVDRYCVVDYYEDGTIHIQESEDKLTKI